MKIKNLLSQAYSSKITGLLIKGIFLGIFTFIVLAFIYTVYLIIIGLLLGQSVLIVGDKSMIDAKVYINNKYEGNMVWDNKLNKTYARDPWTFGVFDLSSINGKYYMPADTMKLHKRYGNFEIKVITKQNKTYIQRYYNLEDLAYSSYNIKDFEEVK